MEEWWPDPFRWDPERFTPARAEDERHTHSWVPFGGGPHLCIGLRFAEVQVKAIMHQMLRRYRWSVYLYIICLYFIITAERIAHSQFYSVIPRCSVIMARVLHRAIWSSATIVKVPCPARRSPGGGIGEINC